MKTLLAGSTMRLTAFAAMMFLTAAVRAADFGVSTPGGAFSYTINSVGNNPTLTLMRGRTYTFAINTSSIHPFRINAPAGTTTNNNINSGTITFVVPTNAANYTYECSVHHFAGTIITIPPPTVRIVSFDFKSNIVLRSTGTNNFSIFPEFKTNLNDTNWFALTVLSNRFSLGTNETFCGRPPGSNVFIRIREQAN
jgi:hypothetical protein